MSFSLGDTGVHKHWLANIPDNISSGRFESLMSLPSLTLWFLAAILVAFLVDRLGLWLESRGWIYWRKKKSSSSAVGSAILELQNIFESGKAKYVIAAKQDPKEQSPDPGGDGANPSRQPDPPRGDPDGR